MPDPGEHSLVLPAGRARGSPGELVDGAKLCVASERVSRGLYIPRPGNGHCILLNVLLPHPHLVHLQDAASVRRRAGRGWRPLSTSLHPPREFSPANWSHTLRQLPTGSPPPAAAPTSRKGAAVVEEVVASGVAAWRRRQTRGENSQRLRVSLCGGTRPLQAATASVVGERRGS